MNKMKQYLRYLIALIPNRYRALDREYYSFLSLLHSNEEKSFEKMQEYQFLQLKCQVENAYNFSDFYRDKYNSHGFKPSQLQSLEDVVKIPILTKDEVRNHAESMVLKNFKGRRYIGYTSGTTGKALTIYSDKRTLSREWASICYQWERVGFSPLQGRVEFRGFIASDDDFIEYPDLKVLRINIIKLGENNIEKVIGKIHKTNYRYFHGYPSAICKFANILKGKNASVQPLAILFASEILYDWQINLIDSVFPNSKKISHFGLTEKVALGAWTEERAYSFIPTYGLLEVDHRNREMIATGFINEIMPFIRYRLTDAIDDFNQTPLNANKTLYPVIKTIIGREEDFTYTESGELVPPAVVTFPFKKLHSIKACKIIQMNLSDFRLIVESDECQESGDEIKGLIADLKKIYGQKVSMTIEKVNHIPTDKSGKFRWIECKIPLRK